MADLLSGSATVTLVGIGFFAELEPGLPDTPRLVDCIDRVPSDIRHLLADYLDSGTMLATSGRLSADVVDGTPAVAPQDVRSDGSYIWPGELGYYVRKYGVALPEEFVAHARARAWN